MIVEEHDFNYCFFIHCPKLENLDLRQDILSNYIFVNAKSLISASINLFLHGVELLQPNFYNRAATLLAGISHLYLSLSAHLLKESECVSENDEHEYLKDVLYSEHPWSTGKFWKR